MGYEVWTNKDTYICSMTLRSKAELQEKIKECEDTINDCRSRLKTLVYMTEPMKFYKGDEDIQWQLNRDFEEVMEEYDDARITLTRLWVFEEAWDETHDAATGKAILPVNPLDLKRRVYMGGDYCEYILENGEEVPEDWWDVYHGFVKPEDCSFREIYGFEPKEPEVERDLTTEELHSLMIAEFAKNGVEVNIDEL